MAVAPEASQVRADPAASAVAEQLFEEHSGWIYGYCLRILRSPEEAEDALQTTYLNACRSLNEGTRPQAGSAWLLRIAHNVCLARLRASGRRSRLERVQDIAVIEETVAGPDRSRDDLIGLADALVGLPESQRKAILLREWQGLSHGEVAHELGLTRSAAEALIFRARRSLATALENPAAPARRRMLRALDLGGLLTLVKGFLGGSAGVKTVAAVTVVAATTATVVATDPANVWRDRHASPPPVAAQPRETAPAPVTSRAVLAPPVSAPDETARAPGRRVTAPGEGRSRGLATAAAAKEKGKEKAAAGKANKGKGKALAPGQAGAAAKGSGNGRGAAASRKAAAPEAGGGPPPHAKAKGLGKKSSKSRRP